MEAANLAAAELEQQEEDNENEHEEQQDQEQDPQEEDDQEEDEQAGQENGPNEHSSLSSLQLLADKAWSQRYQSLLKFGSEYGHYNVPPGREYPLPCGNMCKLGRWLSMQRKAKRGGNMDPEKLQLLQVSPCSNQSCLTIHNHPSILTPIQSLLTHPHSLFIHPIIPHPSSLTLFCLRNWRMLVIWAL